MEIVTGDWSVGWSAVARRVDGDVGLSSGGLPVGEVRMRTRRFARIWSAVVI